MNGRLEDLARLDGVTLGDSSRLLTEKASLIWLNVSLDGQRLKLLYNGIIGGEIEDVDSPTWLSIWYRGVLTWKGEPTMGTFVIRVEGRGLDLYDTHLTKGCLRVLKPGLLETGSSIKSITLKALEVVMPEED